MQTKKQLAEEEDIIFGVRAVIEAVRAERPINKILIQKGMQKELFLELKSELANKRYNLQFVPIYKLNKISRKNHQGVIALVSPIEYVEIEPIIDKLYQEGELPLLLVLDQITDVRNFGAIARTAECCGVHAIVIPQKDSVSVTPDAIKTSAGALNKIPVARVQDLSSLLHQLKSNGVQLVGATEKAKKQIDQVDFDRPTAIILGSEESGISSKILAMCDEKAGIPMSGSISSLNVSVSGGIMIYEAIRQRGV